MARPADPKPRLEKGYWTVRILGKDHHLRKDRRLAFAKFHRLMAERLSNESGKGRPRTVNGAVAVWLTRNKSPKHIGWLRQFVRFARASILAT